MVISNVRITLFKLRVTILYYTLWATFSNRAPQSKQPFFSSVAFLARRARYSLISIRPLSANFTRYPRQTLKAKPQLLHISWGVLGRNYSCSLNEYTVNMKALDRASTSWMTTTLLTIISADNIFSRQLRTSEIQSVCTYIENSSMKKKKNL